MVYTSQGYQNDAEKKEIKSEAIESSYQLSALVMS